MNTDSNGIVDYNEIGLFYQRFKDANSGFKIIYELKYL